MLLADFHIHTTWSDGKLSMREVVDLFGQSGHDVIAITDHVVSTDHLVGRTSSRMGLSVTEANWPRYRDELAAEAERGMELYDMLVIPGFELTQNRFRRAKSAHVLALDVDDFISADGTVEAMLVRAREAGAVVVACHPHEQSDWWSDTFYLWERRSEVAELLDLWEVACRWDLFPPVARAKFPFMGNSDFHDRPHLYAWKTLMAAEKNRQSVIGALRSGRVWR